MKLIKKLEKTLYHMIQLFNTTINIEHKNKLK